MPDAQGRPLRFIGTTLWTDFDALVDLRAPLTAQLQARDKAFRAANFYLKKTNTTRNGAPFLAEAVREQALRCQDWLRCWSRLPSPYRKGRSDSTYWRGFR